VEQKVLIQLCKAAAFGLTALALLPGCEDDLPPDIDVRDEMREFVIGISEYAKACEPSFAVIPQNGIELVSVDGESDGPLHSGYLEAIDGHGQEDLFYGYDRDDRATKEADNTYLRAFLDRSLEEGNVILVTDYCSTHSNMDDSYAKNHAAGYVSFAASSRELDRIPAYPATVYNENDEEVTDLPQVRNFLYLINPGEFPTREAFIQALTATNYDLLIMDLFFADTIPFLPAEIASLKNKANGGKRLVVAYMSIGEAEDYRYYWEEDWDKNAPSWLDDENPRWEGNYKVRYWEEAWQEIIFGSQDSYLGRILEAGFDGVYLDIIDAFEYYE
jgi:cysteinyl-tRNA synthetase